MERPRRQLNHTEKRELDPNQPDSYPRKILLAVTGLSPQIVTETLYALAIEPASDTSRFTPTEIHLVTTSAGAEHARLNLLSRDPGRFHRMCRDYPNAGLERISFDESHIHVIPGANGDDLEDIRDSRDNDLAADFVTALVREFSADDTGALHVSIAGGRKTLGYYLGYALSLFGRKQDRLSHVLVSEPFEHNPGFYYPTPDETVLHINRGGTEVAYDCRTASIDLALIPFVRLRHGLPNKLLEGGASFTEVVSEAQKSLPQISIAISLEKRQIEFSGEAISFPPAQLAFYALLACRQKAGEGGIHWSFDSLAEAYLDIYSRIVGPNSAYYERTAARLTSTMPQQFIEQQKSKINRQLVEILGERLAASYRVRQLGKIPRTGYRIVGLDIDPATIRFQ